VRIGLLGILAVLSIVSHAAEPAMDPVFAQWRTKADPAIENALGWLQRAQKQDGSFEGSYGDTTGVPALVGMAILSKGHLPTEGKYSDTLNRSIDFILANQSPEGLFEKGRGGEGPMYAHNIATLYLSEVSGMLDPERQKRVSQALAKALALILRAQAVEKNETDTGGWRYHPGSKDSDTSCSGWALMALRSAKLNGAAIPDDAIRKAVEYLHRHQRDKEGSFGYTKWEDHAMTLTGMGLLCLELCGEHGSERTKLAAGLGPQELSKTSGRAVRDLRKLLQRPRHVPDRRPPLAGIRGLDVRPLPAETIVRRLMGKPRGRTHLRHRHDGARLHRPLPPAPDLSARRNGGRGALAPPCSGRIDRNPTLAQFHDHHETHTTFGTGHRHSELARLRGGKMDPDVQRQRILPVGNPTPPLKSSPTACFL
jgi:hypothetical protein